MRGNEPENKMENKLAKTIEIAIIIGFCLGVVSAEIIIAGNNYTFQVNTVDSLFWDVVGNSSNMDGFEVHQDIYDNYSNITFIINYRMKPDSFTVILFSNKTIVKEVPVYHGGGGGTKTIYKDRNITIEKEVEKIIYVNQTEDKEEPAETEKEKFVWIYVLCGILILAIIFMWYMVLKRERKREKKNEFR